MDEHNPYAPPQTNVEDAPEAIEGPRIPWEDPKNHPGFFDRVVGTVRMFLAEPATAGAALGASQRMGPPITFYAVLALPILWVVQFLMAAIGPVGLQPAFFEMLGLPVPPPLTSEQITMQRTISMIASLLVPVGVAIYLAVSGLLNHAGLWMMRGLRSGRGLEVTFRTTIYGHALMAVVSWIGNLWILLPLHAGLALLGLTLLFWFAFVAYEGFLLAKAHQTEVWRGVLGVFLPPILLTCCCGGLLGMIVLMIRMGR